MQNQGPHEAVRKNRNTLHHCRGKKKRGKAEVSYREKNGLLLKGS